MVTADAKKATLASGVSAWAVDPRTCGNPYHGQCRFVNGKPRNTTLIYETYDAAGKWRGYMEEIQATKADIRNQMSDVYTRLADPEKLERVQQIEYRLFEFANFLEAKIVLLYMANANEVATENIIRRSFEYNKIIVLPKFNPSNFKMEPLKIDDLDSDMAIGSRGILEPDQDRCRKVPLECIDIAIIPGVALDEKGGRIGSGEGYYDRFIPRLPNTTRKVALAFEDQVLSQVPMESNDKHVDIIITDKRVIYKI